MDIIKTGICSYGMSGKLFHAPFIQSHPGFELTAIVERHKNDSRERYPDSKLYRSFEELIADESIRLVVVNTPVQLHHEQVSKALLAGKDVVAEKPFTVNAREAMELEDLAAKTGRTLTVYQNRRYDGDYKAIREVVEDNLLGRLCEVEFRYDRYRITSSGKDHKEGDQPGAGILHDLGAHLIDQSIQLFGFPEAVFADAMTLRDGVAANDYFELLLFYPRMRVRLKGTVVARETTTPFILHGINGSFLQERSDMQEQELLKGAIPTIKSWCPGPAAPDGLLHTTVNGVEVNKATTSSPGNYMGFYDDVYKALTGQADNPVPASDAVKTMRVIDAAMESIATGVKVRL
ncbi:Gfo/Idh/MocA family oxidoreductase [Flavihumibacter rivuli]|uniref:Gfo/Idh/MocA family oxidoreductase n=1 Tax=Flavihumibacter rivuli TaxID=2838156 RepID=UPI001BDE41C8|nr:Gfo/Idh/MocA family oxidoreductase [Flavihumibacter rivuli]ULQ55995.1 Gfo/Idh/MocA family oxidoreductase [Flavihumibacter rivuli]